MSIKTTIEGVPENDGDVRRLILETIVGVRDGALDVPQAAVMVAGFKELNTSMSVSINAAKLSLQMGAAGGKFMKNLRLGQQLIRDNEAE